MKFGIFEANTLLYGDNFLTIQIIIIKRFIIQSLSDWVIINEIRIKEIQKVKKIVVSSLFKKNKNYLGINRFKLLRILTKKQVVALGGISKKNVKKFKLLNFPEFAGISYFKK